MVGLRPVSPSIPATTRATTRSESTPSRTTTPYTHGSEGMRTLSGRLPAPWVRHCSDWTNGLSEPPENGTCKGLRTSRQRWTRSTRGELTKWRLEPTATRAIKRDRTPGSSCAEIGNASPGDGRKANSHRQRTTRRAVDPRLKRARSYTVRTAEPTVAYCVGSLPFAARDQHGRSQNRYRTGAR